MTHIFVHHMHAWYLQKRASNPQEQVTDGFELPWGTQSWTWSLGKSRQCILIAVLFVYLFKLYGCFCEFLMKSMVQVWEKSLEATSFLYSFKLTQNYPKPDESTRNSIPPFYRFWILSNTPPTTLHRKIKGTSKTTR